MRAEHRNRLYYRCTQCKTYIYSQEELYPDHDYAGCEHRADGNTDTCGCHTEYFCSVECADEYHETFGKLEESDAQSAGEALRTLWGVA